MKLTVYFDGSFWYGLIEYHSIHEEYRACRHLFGKEPKDVEVMEFVARDLPKLISNNERRLANTKGNSLKELPTQKKLNPKRMQRSINKEKRKPVVSTKAQLTISAARSETKAAKKVLSKEKKEQMQAERFAQKQAKKLQKRKGH